MNVGYENNTSFWTKPFLQMNKISIKIDTMDDLIDIELLSSFRLAYSCSTISKVYPELES